MIALPYAADQAADLIRSGRPAGLAASIAARDCGLSVAEVARALSARRRRPGARRVVAHIPDSPFRYWYQEL